MTPPSKCRSRPDSRRARPGVRLRAALSRAATLALLAFLLPSCTKKGAAGGGGFGGKMPPVPVETARVESQTVRDGFTALGTLEAADQVTITSELAGKVTALPFHEGQPIGRGGLIAVIDDREISADAKRTQAIVERERLNFERMQKLAERGNVSAKELDGARADLGVAEANAQASRARLDKTRIRAPFAGIIGRRQISPGAYVTAGQAIADLAQLDELRLSFEAPERFAGRLRVGTPVEVRTAAFPDRPVTGTVRVIDPVIDPRTRTLSLLARVPNPGRAFLPGMSANVIATLSERPNALVVPDAAVFAEGSQSYVFLIKADSSVAKAAITLGTRDSSRVEVLTGLAAGDRVVRAGHQKLFEGARVMPVESGASGGGAAPAAGAKKP
jgi:membrane fusion protein (multidrug efflux system)